MYWFFPHVGIEFVLLVSFRSCDGFWSADLRACCAR